MFVFCMLIAYRRQARAEKEERMAAEDQRIGSTDAMIEVLSSRNSKLTSELDHLRRFAERVRAAGWGSPSPARRARPLVYRISSDGNALEGQTLEMMPPPPQLEEEAVEEEEWETMLPIQTRLPRGLPTDRVVAADGEQEKHETSPKEDAWLFRI